ncbi:MAG: hypothetical protein JWP74_2419, partial [Marmoricola sp.]|nr:hypothetical protein [Marmoricola sp.]
MTSTRTRSAGAVLAVVAALAVAACSAGPVPPASHGAAIVTPPSTTTPSAPSNTDADNRSVALAAARRALRRLRLPPGSARLAGRPHGLPRDTGYGTWSDGPTAWFSVPLGRGAVSAYEHAKPPLGWFSDGSGESPATSSIEFDPRRQASPARFTGPSLEVVWGDFEGHAVLEAHAEAEARHVRPPQSLVGTAVGRVEVSRVATRTTGTAGPS